MNTEGITSRSTRAADRASSEVSGSWPPPGYRGRSPKGKVVSFFGRLFGRKSNTVTDPDKVPDAFKQVAPVFDEIGAEAIGCCPDNWTNAVLTITCDGRRIDYSLKNHRGELGTATITPRLAQLAERLYTLMASTGDRWTKAELRYDQDGDSWKFKSNFSYD